MTFQNSGTCSSAVDFDLKDGVIHNVRFTRGCDGNLKAIAKLVEGRRAEEIIALFKGHQCKGRPTSCADQFARALERGLAAQGA
ncbi:MAG: TIGR03905 family TSCPD domain-containing protein [Spirochaetaceae bacterium]|jgi:uncharacterized protein (TIGR03905 family)|nr:TIGR03905 family TSCPD domain-containing protein [Spirochaetaceae bacterium]